MICHLVGGPDSRNVGQGRRRGHIHISLVTLATLSSPLIKHYTSMYAYGQHFRVDDEAGRSHVSFDSGVACLAIQTCKSSRANRNPVEATLRYVGIVKDILEVEYGHLKYNVLRCSSIRPNLQGLPCIKVDEDGFWSVKFHTRQSLAMEPYVLPSHAK